MQLTCAHHSPSWLREGAIEASKAAEKDNDQEKKRQTVGATWNSITANLMIRHFL